MAIISTYNENCGNASYTGALKRAFERYADVDVFALDLFLLQSKAFNLVKAGDRHIKDICQKLRGYDYVNIQFEAGLYGARIPDMLRRLRWLVDAAPNVTLTLHRVDYDNSRFWDAVKLGIASRSYKKFKQTRGARHFSALSKSVIEHCKRAGARKNVWIKVHTRREYRAVREIYLNENVFDYPLAFLTPEQLQAAWDHNDRSDFLRRYGFEPGDKVIGLFGYLSNYKGIETAIEALSLLPKEYKLGLFGNQHPQTVKRGEPLNPYLKSIFDLMEDIDQKSYEQSMKFASLGGARRSNSDERLNDNPGRDEGLHRISDRIRFIGSLPDPEFIEALRLSDAVVLPYLEVGQSMSGVAVLGMEAGAKMICANNHSFAETKRYYRDCFMGFDMGNAFELAQRIMQCVTDPELAEFRENRLAAFEQFNIDNSVRLQLEKFGFSQFGTSS